MLEYHSRVKETFYLDNTYVAFSDIYKNAKSKGYINHQSGTNPNKHSAILHNFYKIFSDKDKYNFKNHGFDIRRLIRDDIIKHDGVVMFTLPQHTVVGKGVVYYNVKYIDKRGNIKTDEIEFFQINEGWWEKIETYVYSKKIRNWLHSNFGTTMRLKK